MRTQTFLTPMTPDGKPGQLVTMQVDDGEQQYLTPDGELVAVAIQSSAPVQFVEPVPYYSLTPDEITALEKERKALSDSLPRLDQGARVKVEKRLRQIDQDLKRQRMIDATVRRHQERIEERPRQAGNTELAVNWSAMSMADQTVVIQAAIKEMRRVGA